MQDKQNTREDHLYHGDVHPWRRLRQMFRGDKTELWVAAVYSIGIGLVTLVLPVATQALVNTVAFGTVLQPIVVLTILVLLALVFAGVLSGYRLWVVEVIQRRVFVRMAGDTTYRLVHMKPEEADRFHTPELVNRFLEVVTVQKAASSLLVDGLSVPMQTLVGMTLLAIYHPWLLAYDVLLLVCILVVLFPLGAGAIPTSVKESKAKYALVAWMEEVARHTIAFKTRPGTKLALHHTSRLVSEYLTYRSKHFRILMRQVAGSYLLQAVASAVLLGVGGWLVVSRQLTLGQLVAAELVVALVLNGITKFGKHLETFYDLMAATDKLGYLQDLQLERSGGEELPAARRGAAVKLMGVGMRNWRGQALLTDVNLEVRAGGRIGIVGATGSGKSTLLDLFYGLRSPSAGAVEIDGRDLRDLKLDEVRSQIALIRQPEVFDGTVLENLRLGNAEMDSAEAREVLARVDLLGEVQNLPEGLNTRLMTGGAPLSPGQSVQLELARGLAHRPRLIIIDEVLDWLDDLPARDRLLDDLFAPDAGWTLIVISGNPDILRRCEAVYELRGGKLDPRPGALASA